MNTLITGSSRGIGFALVQHALLKGHQVLAVARDTSKLEKLKTEFPKSLHLIAANVSEAQDIRTVEHEVARIIAKSGDTLDVLINNAGVYRKEETAEAFAESFHVNATTPFLLSKALYPHLRKSKSPKVVQISTLMGSIADNSSGGSYAYRSSKSALNMITKSLAIDHPEVTYALIHPGWVKTEMGGAEAPVEIEDSALGIWRVIEAMRPEDSGAYKDFQGRSLSW